MHPRALPPSPENIRAMRVDVVGGMVSACSIMFAIVVAAAITLHRNGITTVATADRSASATRAASMA